MWRCGLFTTLIACSSAPPPPAAPITPIVVDAGVVIDAPPELAQRGGACSSEQSCAPALTCLGSSSQTPGGYCTSSCHACDDGVCIPTTHAGALCMQRCASDADCRAGDGYVCDPLQRACVTPNLAVITPRACAALVARDKTAGAVTAVSSELGAQRAPSAVLLPSGGLLVAFTSELVGGARIIASAGSVSTTIASEGPRGEVSLARDRKGIVYAAWLDAGRILLARSRDNGTTWSSPDRADDPSDCVEQRDCLGPPTIVSGGDALYVVYGAADAIRVRASLDEGATFRAAVTAAPGMIANAYVGADGALHVIALDARIAPPPLTPPGGTAGPPLLGAFGTGNSRVQYTVSRDGGRTFTPPQRLDRRDEQLPAYFARPQIVVDARRRMLYALYVRGGRDGVWDLVLLASRDAGATWTRTRIGDDCAVHAVPQLAVDAAGTVHVAYYDSRGRFAHATCAKNRCTQRGAINDAPFTLSLARMTPAWIGEHAALVVDDKRRRIHAVWTRPQPDGVTRVETAQLAVSPK